MWDLRYSVQEYVYGKNPNGFLRENITKLKKGEVLCIGEGEGRNAVFLAKQGFKVTALDSSAVGLNKAQQLATENGIEIATIHADLNDYSFEAERWDSIVSIFCHLPVQLRRKVYAGVKTGLKKDGIFILEAYTPKQIEFGTGGPPTAELMMTLDILKEELTGLEFLYGVELIRVVEEGTFHSGKSAVVQIIVKKP